MVVDARRDHFEEALSDGDGIVRLEPAWVGRDFLPAGRRLGLAEGAYDLGDRGELCERWLGSTTRADNQIGPLDEGLSYISVGGAERITLKDAVDFAPEGIMGSDYAATHSGLGRLAKIFDYRGRLPYHLHQRQEHAALMGGRSKDEAYYFPPGQEMGAHPETYLGVHPSIVENEEHDVLLPYLVDWDSDLILRHSVAYLQVIDEGFHVPSGVLHAPGSALTIELQEDSDVFAMLQAVVDGTEISKDLLWKDVRPEDRERMGERFILELIDWEENGDPYFFENHHLSPQLIRESRGPKAARSTGSTTTRLSSAGRSWSCIPGVPTSRETAGCTTSSSGRAAGATAGPMSRVAIPPETSCSSRATERSEASRSGTPDARTCSRSSSSVRTSTPTSP